MTTSSIAGPGFGLGLRTEHYQDFLARPQRVDWLEVITDNFLVEGGKPLQVLDTLRRDYPIAMHGVAMSLGSVSGLDAAYLHRVKRLAKRFEPMWVSDHLCWTGFGPHVLHDLYPMPYTEESARLLIAQIRQAQDVLERRLLVENVSSYVRFAGSTQTESAFLAHVIEEADCDLLLDVNNVYVSSINHGFSAEAYLLGLPAARVRQMHLAGHSRNGAQIVDTHDQAVAPEVWALYAMACQRFPAAATMIERDGNIPPLAMLVEELDRARETAGNAAVAADLAPRLRDRPRGAAAGAAPTLHLTQRCLAEYILDASPARVPEQVEQAGPLPAQDGMGIYHRAYRERLADVLADSYAKCASYLGPALFKELAYRHIEAHAPRERHLGRYGADFASLLAAAYPGNAELADLARLEWALREVFDAADVPAWMLADIRQKGPDTCLAQDQVLHPSLRLHAMHTNAVPIWRAIDAGDEVPPVERWPRPGAVAVWRKGLQPHFKSLDPAEAVFLGELAVEGATIGGVAQDWADSGRLSDPAILGGWLAAWWSDEMLRRVDAA